MRVLFSWWCEIARIQVEPSNRYPCGSCVETRGTVTILKRTQFTHSIFMVVWHLRLQFNRIRIAL